MSIKIPAICPIKELLSHGIIAIEDLTEMFGLEKNKVKLEKQLDKANTPEKAKTIQSQLDGINRAIQENISETNLIKDELIVRNQTDIEAGSDAWTSIMCCLHSTFAFSRVGGR